MIRGMDTANFPQQTSEQGSTEETTPCKPDLGAQKQDITPHLKTEGGNSQEPQNVGLSSRTVTDLKTPSRPYKGTAEYKYMFMDNNPRSHYFATYANLPVTVAPKTVRIGNQDLITLDTSQSFINPNLAEEKNDVKMYNFKFLSDFLSKNNTIEFIVDIGCGDAALSLRMQKYLNEQGFPIKVIPVDTSNVCCHVYDYYDDNEKPLPINLIPAQEIVGATPATTLFTSIHAFTGMPSKEKKLNRRITEGETEFYLTTLIKNNPGCFVMATEDPHTSSPQNFIPPELVYTKHYHAFANLIPSDDAKAKAAEMNAENSDIDQLNQLLAKLPEQRDNYLDSILSLKDRLKEETLKEPWKPWPYLTYTLHIRSKLREAGLKTYESIKHEAYAAEVEMRCWHVYRQDKPRSG
ncbi:retrotransposon gag domain-containing protein [Endozoicomonas sp. 4G]|uniref:retrotransposon gag domain-containing protein n=1 Tax=Endozoicomonas sp. 4G TaxID=2872754 RepID=UPI002078FC1A|nr:retrotransposon gag domain-containing protein [Endozoicomonas sp. 4G]